MPVSLPTVQRPATHRTPGQSPKPCYRAVQDTLTAIAAALAGSAEDESARALAEEAEMLARSATDTTEQVQTIGRLVRAMVRIGTADHAERLAGSVVDPQVRLDVMRVLAESLATAGATDRALEIARSLPPEFRDATLAAAARTLATAGQDDRAEQLAHSLSSPMSRAQALFGVARALTEGKLLQARRLISDATAQMREQLGHEDQRGAAVLCRLLAKAGDIRGAQDRLDPASGFSDGSFPFFP